MSSRSLNTEELEHRPARSGTPTAWIALALLAALVAGWLFFDSMVCGMLRIGLAAVAWNQRVQLSIGHLALVGNGGIQAQGVGILFGPADHRSSWKSEWIEIRPAPLLTLVGFSRNKKNRLIQEITLGRTKLLADRRGENHGAGGRAVTPRLSCTIPWIQFLPDACSATQIDLVVIGENYRISVGGLTFSLPNQWAGKMLYTEALLDVGSMHDVFPPASADANWDGTTLHLSKLGFSKEFRVEELTLAPQDDHLEFGVRGTVGGGLIRGDGAFSLLGGGRNLEATLVGENLTLTALSMMVNEGDQRATGTVRQGRFTFRGDLAKPLEADCSLRLVANDFRWEGRGWDSLRLAATLTGRVLTLSELSLHQKDNEVEAEGRSKLPEDWHAALKAPFTASFHADLDDAGALASLAGPDFAQLSGGLVFEGAIKGSDNRAEGYCNLLGSGMKIRNLPVDWLKGSLLFEGGKTCLSNLEAWSGGDRVVMEGSVENNAPHTYAATAEFGIGNLTKRLAQLGIATASQLGGGAVKGTWKGDGSAKGHSGSFQAIVNNWVSPWTTAGMSGQFEGTYSPGHLYCSKVEFQQRDLRLDLQLSASPTRLEATSIVATRNGRSEPSVAGFLSLPVNAPALWKTGDLVSNLGMTEPLDVRLSLHGIKAEELADLLGQHIPCTGTLAGDLSAAGTPEKPEIHSTLNIAKLALPGASETMGLTWNFDSSAGRAAGSLVQDPAKDSPLTLQAELPFRLVADKGSLRFADITAAVHAVATLHRVPLNGWLALWKGGDTSWSLRDGTLDGSLTLGGTLDKLTVEGSLLLGASAVILPGMPSLGSLSLPITCSLSKATTTGGNALCGGKSEERPVALSGVFDWSQSPWTSRLDLSGQDLAFPAFSGLESRGDAQVSLGMSGTNAPVLAGNLTIKHLTSPLPSRVTPFFTPPGVVLSAPARHSGTESNVLPQIQLDLQAKTEGYLSSPGKSVSDPAQLLADLRVQGSMNALRWSGVIEAKNHWIDLPAGSFLIPEARLQNASGSGPQLAFTAYGLTRYGFCTLKQEGDLQNSLPWFDAPAAGSGVTAADLVLALATPAKPAATSSLLGQTPAWIRQNTLFSVPPLGWVTRHFETNDPSTLGFYGNFWSAGIQPSTPPSLPSVSEPR